MVKYPTGSLTHYTKIKNWPSGSRKQKHRKRCCIFWSWNELEQQINESNKYYLLEDIAVVHKKPTPVQIVSRLSNVLVQSLKKLTGQASTTDYNGVYQGRYLDFEAKETRNKRSFPLKNFHESDHPASWKIVKVCRCLHF